MYGVGSQRLIKPEISDEVYQNKLILEVQTIDYLCSSHCVLLRRHQLISEYA